MSLAPIRLGVIGGGAAFRTLHWPVLEKSRSRFCVEAIANRSLETAEAAARAVAAPKAYSDYHELLADPGIEAVLIAVPIPLNARVLLDAVAAGKHVIAEKPLAASEEEARHVCEICSGMTNVVLIAENYRYRKDLRKTRALLDSGAIGEVFAFRLETVFDLDAPAREIWISRPWRQEGGYPGGFVLDAAVHPIAFLRGILGDIEEVDGRSLNRHPTVGGSDTLLLQMKLAGGIVGQFFACYTAKVETETPLSLRIYGSKGTMQILPGFIRVWNGSAKTIKTDRNDRGYAGQWANFYGAIRKNEPVLSSPEEAFKDVLTVIKSFSRQT